MQSHSEDPRITAYVLGELSPEDAAAVESAAAADPAVLEKIREVEEIQRFLKERLATPTAQLLPRQRENIRRIAREGNVAAFSWKSRQPWVIAAAAAAVLALATFLLLRPPSHPPTQVAGPVSPAPTTPVAPAIPAEPPAPVVAPPPPGPTIARNFMIPAADAPTLELPIFPGKPNLTEITKSIVEDGKLPPHESVRLAEILNSFPLRLDGTAAIARGGNAPWHPDNRDSGIRAHLATLATETIACPWKPSATLLLISVRSNGQQDSDVKIAFRPNPENIARYRLLGFPPQDGTPAGTVPTRLPAGSYTTLAIEIESSKPGTDLGSLEWSADEKPAPSISIQHKSAAEPSDDARFATLVCTWSQWLAGEQTGGIDREIISALARENTSATLPADRAELLKLIERSLQL
jgi:hypothetical protein